MNQINHRRRDFIRLAVIIAAATVAIIAIISLMPSAEVECVKAKGGAWKSDGMLYRPYCHWETQK